MLDSIQKHSEHILRHPSGVVAVALGTTALTLDHFFGAHESRSRRHDPEFYAARPNIRALGALAILPGCQTDGQQYFQAVRARLPEATLVGLDYPKHGFDIEQVCEGLADNLIRARAEHPSLLCQSMGGMVMRQFMQYADQTGLADRVGGFGTVVLDSSPFDSSDIRTSYQVLLTAASTGRYSWAADHLKRKIYDSVRGSEANAHLDTIYSEGRYMKQMHDTQPLPAIMDRVVYVHGTHDPVINSNQAALKYETVAPKSTFTKIVDEARESPSHTASGPHLDTLLELTALQAIEQEMPLQRVPA